ncbi:GIY-YIG nuclease family protein [Spirosoma sp. BT702]|uniref:GIY-YIG nuclease family protein n=1 Tax=Spirosoma profusum TaxID=2771354 RepID=A0A927AR47_9BACT|nr:GIY-YIG nuclease family protein [Spirosoma profusum]MBD2699165.1 GIY-YIG nuclease family protein [Spirosoma profusum]
MHNYAFYVYIVTNPEKTTLYTGMTNDLARRLSEHYETCGQLETFTGKYYCYLLVYWEFHLYVRNAILREKEIKGWVREKKVALIESVNPEWRILNDEIQG